MTCYPPPRTRPLPASLTGIVMLLAATFSMAVGTSPKLTEQESGKFAPTRIMVHAPDLSVSAAARVIDSHTSLPTLWIRTMSGGTQLFQVSEAVDQAALITALNADNRIEHAQGDLAVTIQAAPTDTLYFAQWTLHGQSQYPAAMRLEKAWEISRGSPETIIAIIDTGVRFEHPDLNNRLLAGYDFVSAVNDAAETVIPVLDAFNYTRSNDDDGRDSDATDPGDGVATDFQTNAANAGIDCGVMDSTWHGTAMASLAGANANDGVGMAGVDQLAQILPVRAIGRCGGNRSDLLDAIRWAAGVDDPALPPNPTPARIINLSLGIDDLCGPADQRAIDDAISAGALIVAAVGNHGRNIDRTPSSPSDCNGVIGVSAVTSAGQRASYSNFGLDADIAAPGGDNSEANAKEVLVATNEGNVSPMPGSSYRYTSGTSVATPLVSGVLSLMLGVNPNLTNDQLEYLLYQSAGDFVRGGAQPCTISKCGAGMVDAYAAVLAAEASLESPVEVPSAFREKEGDVTTGGGAGCSIGTNDPDPVLLLLLVALYLYKQRRRLSIVVFTQAIR